MRKTVTFVAAALFVAPLFATPHLADAQQAPVAAAPVAAPTPPPADPRAQLSGQFSFVGGARERQNVTAQIEAAVQRMFFAIRPIARGRLERINPIYNSVSINAANGQLDVTLAGSPRMLSREGVRTPWTGRGGEQTQMTQRIDGAGHLVQELVGDSGTRRNDFSVSPDGHTLTLRVRITSSSLSQPLTYALTYRR